MASFCLFSFVWIGYFLIRQKASSFFKLSIKRLYGKLAKLFVDVLERVERDLRSRRRSGSSRSSSWPTSGPSNSRPPSRWSRVLRHLRRCRNFRRSRHPESGKKAITHLNIYYFFKVVVLTTSCTIKVGRIFSPIVNFVKTINFCFNLSYK